MSSVHGAKTVLITGGGRGIARVTAEKLAGQGHRVIMTVRAEQAGEAAVAAIQKMHPRALVEYRLLDLASLDAVRLFALQLLSDGLRLDVLFNSAGIMQQSRQRRLTVDGLEETLAVNAIAPFLLARLLMPGLEKSGTGRIVNVSSRLHMPGSRGAPVSFDFSDPNLEQGYDHDRAYKNSKLAVLWLTYALARWVLPRQITVNAVCPGFVPTTGAASTHGFMRFFMAHVLSHMPFARSVDEAAESFAFMATDPSLDLVTGKFFGEEVAIASSADSYDEDKMELPRFRGHFSVSSRQRKSRWARRMAGGIRRSSRSRWWRSRVRVARRSNSSVSLVSRMRRYGRG
jgi:retinol dehydrogenase 12